MKTQRQRVLSIHYAAWLVDYFEQRGVGAEQLLASTGLLPSMFGDPDTVMTEDQHQQLLLNALKSSKKPSLGLELGCHRKFFTLASLGNAMLFSSTLRESIEFGIKYQACTGRYSGYSLILSFFVEDAIAVFQVDDDPVLGELRVFAIEEMLANIITQSKVITGEALPLVQVSCAYPQPEHADVYEALFQCPVLFGAPKTQIQFQANVLDVPLPQASSTSAKLFAEECDRFVSNRQGQDLQSDIRIILIQQPTKIPSADEMAAMLCCSPRTLRRKLQEFDTSYQKIVEQVRSGLAQQYLKNTHLEIAEVAYALGYSDSAAFNRAFKKWTGVTPGSFRRG